MTSENKKIILFDGVCNLCNTWIQFVIKHDKKDVFRFAALQSEFGKNIIKEINIDTSKIDSIILYESKNVYYYKSDAVIKIAQNLGFGYNLLVVFKIIPKIIRNYIYDFIAKNRYKWFGRKESCMIPSPELKAKFLA